MAEIRIRIPDKQFQQVVKAVGSAVGIEKPTKESIRAHLVKHLRDIVKQEVRRAAIGAAENKITFSDDWGDLEEKAGE